MPASSFPGDPEPLLRFTAEFLRLGFAAMRPPLAVQYLFPSGMKGSEAEFVAWARREFPFRVVCSQRDLRVEAAVSRMSDAEFREHGMESRGFRETFPDDIETRAGPLSNTQVVLEGGVEELSVPQFMNWFLICDVGPIDMVVGTWHRPSQSNPAWRFVVAVNREVFALALESTL